MERNALIAIVVSLIILFVYNEVVIKKYYHTEPGQTVEENPPLAPSAAAPTTIATESAGEPRPERAPAAEESAPVIAGTDVVVDTELYHAVFTTAGARLKSFALKHYRSTVAKDSPPLDLVREAGSQDYPLGIQLRGQNDVGDAGVEYRIDRESLALTGDAAGVLTFTGTLRGATVTKRIQVTGDSYLLNVDLRVTGVSAGYSEMAVGWNREVDVSTHTGHEMVVDHVLAVEGAKLRREAVTGLEKGELSGPPDDYRDVGAVRY